MKRAFTLLELIIVMIIIGILAGLGIPQYNKVIERSRGAEARQALGAIRSTAAALYLDNNNNCDDDNLGIGSDYPSSCGQTTHYFSYSANCQSGSSLRITATRCTSGGKPPAGSGGWLRLDANLDTGTATWNSSGDY